MARNFLGEKYIINAYIIIIFIFLIYSYFIRVHKPFKCCCAAVGGPCQKEITVSMMSGEEVGYVQQPCLGGCCTPTLDIYNKKEGGSRIAQLTGPCLLGFFSYKNLI
jgi:hypothetical protein